ncbi:MAG: tRNA (cytidine(34)-2'-O)-methyltransferase [Pseudomonadota bacterium]
MRFKPLSKPLGVVLVEPEIPQNTGSIARTCAATGSTLHLVGRLGFSISEHAVKRAGLDYWDKVEVFTHDNMDSFVRGRSGGAVFLFSSRAARPYTAAPWVEGCSLVFGKETAGLPESLLGRYPDAVYGIPTLPSIRSLNLSNAVSVVIYECLRKLGAFEDL